MYPVGNDLPNATLHGVTELNRHKLCGSALIIFGYPEDDQSTHIIGKGGNILSQLKCPAGAVVVPGAMKFQILVFRHKPVYEAAEAGLVDCSDRGYVEQGEEARRQHETYVSGRDHNSAGH
jgi:hypothetical protein